VRRRTISPDGKGSKEVRFCAEIQYEGGIHSDICWNCDTRQPDKPLTDDYRKFLHDCLDEWLDKSEGTGHFVVGHWGEVENL